MDGAVERDAANCSLVENTNASVVVMKGRVGSARFRLGHGATVERWISLFRAPKGVRKSKAYCQRKVARSTAGLGRLSAETYASAPLTAASTSASKAATSRVLIPLNAQSHRAMLQAAPVARHASRIWAVYAPLVKIRYRTARKSAASDSLVVMNARRSVTKAAVAHVSKSRQSTAAAAALLRRPFAIRAWRSGRSVCAFVEPFSTVAGTSVESAAAREKRLQRRG